MATSHKRETARRTPPAAVLAGSLAVLATGAVVAAGVLASSPTAPSEDLLAGRALPSAAEITGSLRDPMLSRSSARDAAPIEPVEPTDAAAAAAEAAEPPTRLQQLMTPEAIAAAVAAATEKRWTTAPLNLWTRPGKAAKKAGELDEGSKVVITGRRYGERAEVVVAGEARWVTKGYFTTEEPPDLGGPCTNGTSVPSRVDPDVKKVHRAVCASFPEIRTYGTFRGDGEHSQGLAVDIMVDGERGWEVARFVREHYRELGVSYVIYAQKIWSVERGGEGWRGMPNRGSRTANHYDHVHVTVVR